MDFCDAVCWCRVLEKLQTVAIVPILLFGCQGPSARRSCDWNDNFRMETYSFRDKTFFELNHRQ